MLPGLVDLRGNVRKDGDDDRVLDGRDVSAVSIHGRVFDWAAQRPVNGAYIEAILRTDTTRRVPRRDRHRRASSTSGRCRRARTLVRALIDQNNEPDARPEREVGHAYRHASRHASARRAAEPSSAIRRRRRSTTSRALDSVTLRVTFDKPLDPRCRCNRRSIRLQRRRFVAARRRARAVAGRVRSPAGGRSTRARTRRLDSTARATRQRAAARRAPPPAARPPAAAGSSATAAAAAAEAQRPSAGSRHRRHDRRRHSSSPRRDVSDHRARHAEPASAQRATQSRTFTVAEAAAASRPPTTPRPRRPTRPPPASPAANPPHSAADSHDRPRAARCPA